MAIEEKPSRNEDEYFVRQDAELLRKQREEQETQRMKQERASHFMKCPKCGADLTTKVMEGVSIDVCGECGGLWLDAGELEQVRQSRKSGVSRFVDDLFGTNR